MSWGDSPRLVPSVGHAAVTPARSCACLCHTVPGIGHLAGPCPCELQAADYWLPAACLEVNCDELRCASGRCDELQAGQLLEQAAVSVSGPGPVVT